MWGFLPYNLDDAWQHSLIGLQRVMWVRRRLGQIDREVAELHREGYEVDCDRLLEERAELTRALDAL